MDVEGTKPPARAPRSFVFLTAMLPFRNKFLKCSGSGNDLQNGSIVFGNLRSLPNILQLVIPLNARRTLYFLLARCADIRELREKQLDPKSDIQGVPKKITLLKFLRTSYS